jgi:hypothetical protein
MGTLLGTSALINLGGIGWLLRLTHMALEIITEYASLDPGVFMHGEISSFNVMNMMNPGYVVVHTASGLIMLLVDLEGYHNRSRWIWITKVGSGSRLQSPCRKILGGRGELCLQLWHPFFYRDHAGRAAGNPFPPTDRTWCCLADEIK